MLAKQFLQMSRNNVLEARTYGKFRNEVGSCMHLPAFHPALQACLARATDNILLLHFSFFIFPSSSYINFQPSSINHQPSAFSLSSTRIHPLLIAHHHDLIFRLVPSSTLSAHMLTIISNSNTVFLCIKMQVLATVTALLSLATALPLTSSAALPVDGVLKMLTRGGPQQLESHRNAFLVGYNFSSKRTPIVHAAIGSGVQNYTCSSNSSAAPVSVGAVANLYNITEWFVSYHSVLMIPYWASLVNEVVELPNPVHNPEYDVLSAMGLQLSGKHYYNPTCLTYVHPSSPCP